MSQLPAHASFHERAEALFSALRGHGLQLSGEDIELVDVWNQSDVPFEVVARGMLKAFEAKQFDAKRDERISLKICRRAVEKEIKLFLRHSTSATTSKNPIALPFHLERFGLLKKKTKMFSEISVVSQWSIKLKEPQNLVEVNRQEITLKALLFRSLPYSTRREISRASTAKSAGASNKDTRLQMFRFHREMLTFEALGIKSF